MLRFSLLKRRTLAEILVRNFTPSRKFEKTPWGVAGERIPVAIQRCQSWRIFPHRTVEREELRTSYLRFARGSSFFA
jgi:hypothetical protein